MNPSPITVRQISECFIKPKRIVEESRQPYYLAPWDLTMLSVHYIQKGLLFTKPAEFDPPAFLDKLKNSLSLTLVHFYPLAGRLETTLKQENPHPTSSLVFIDCNKGPGARFIHSALDMTVSDILSPIDVPRIVQSFFDHDRAVNHDGHTSPLLSVQVTELVDGIFIGCSINHMVVDGTSFWHFFNAWSEIFEAEGDDFAMISRPPVLNRWCPDGHDIKNINLPFADHNEFINRYEAPELRERVFHFSSESIAKLKAKANAEWNTHKISSLQALSALVWRCITRARRLPLDQITSCRMAANNRSRLHPPLSPNYFGNCMQPVRGIATPGELFEHNLGWAAWKLHETVANHTDEMVRRMLEQWLQSPCVYQLGVLFDPFSVMMGSSPRFDMYGNEFGLGKALGLRSGYANKFDGKVSLYPGFEGGGSMDLEVCLKPDFMAALECDEEFMAAVSFPN